MSLNTYSKHQIIALKVSAIVSTKVITFFYSPSALNSAGNEGTYKKRAINKLQKTPIFDILGMCYYIKVIKKYCNKE